jgi:hypothetical protein
MIAIPVLVNTVLCLLQLLAEKVEQKMGRMPKRHSIIPGSKQKFLCWEDYYCQTYGDILGLVWVMIGFYSMIIKLTNYEWLMFGVLCLISFIIFLVPRIKKDKRPTWGESNGKISIGGYIHSVYFSLSLAMTVMCLYGMLIGKLIGVYVVLVLGGVLIWSVSCLIDLLVGNFAPLKKGE